MKSEKLNRPRPASHSHLARPLPCCSPPSARGLAAPLCSGPMAPLHLPGESPRRPCASHGESLRRRCSSPLDPPPLPPLRRRAGASRQMRAAWRERMWRPLRLPPLSMERALRRGEGAAARRRSGGARGGRADAAGERAEMADGALVLPPTPSSARGLHPLRAASGARCSGGGHAGARGRRTRPRRRAPQISTPTQRLRPPAR